MGFFKAHDLSDSGAVTQDVFEEVMYRAVGVHYPVTKAVIKQYFDSCKQGSKISYKKIGEDVVKKLDTSV